MQTTQQTLAHVADRMSAPTRRTASASLPWANAQGTSPRGLVSQVLAMHERDHQGSARFCETAEASRSADIIAR